MSLRKLLVFGLVVLCAGGFAGCGVGNAGGGGDDDNEPDELRYVYYGEFSDTLDTNDSLLRWDISSGVTENVFSDPQFYFYFAVDSKTKDVYYLSDYASKIVKYSNSTGVTSDILVSDDRYTYDYFRFDNDRLYYWQNDGGNGSGVYTSSKMGDDIRLLVHSGLFDGDLQVLSFDESMFYLVSESSDVLYFYSGMVDGSNFELDFTLDQFSSPSFVDRDSATGYWYVHDHDEDEIFRVNATGTEIVSYTSELVVDLSIVKVYSGQLFWTNDDQGEANSHSFYHATASSDIQIFDLGENIGIEWFELVLD